MSNIYELITDLNVLATKDHNGMADVKMCHAYEDYHECTCGADQDNKRIAELVEKIIKEVKKLEDTIHYADIIKLVSKVMKETA